MLLNVKDLREQLRVSEPLVRKLLRAGTLRALKVGRAWRVTPEALSQFLRGEQPSEKKETAA